MRPTSCALTILATLFLSSAWCIAADDRSTASAQVVTHGRDAGQAWSKAITVQEDNHAEDHPDLRNQWFMRQRLYPLGSLPSGAYSGAAREYLKRRELTRQVNRKLMAGFAASALPTGAWTEVGPAPISPNGTVGYGSVAGRISAVAVDPSDPGTLLIGGSRGGVWRTTDNGAIWVPVGDDQSTLAIADIAFCKADPRIVYAATGDDDVTFWGQGVLKSYDGGIHWQRIDDGSYWYGIQDGQVLSKIAVDPTNCDNVTVAARIDQNSNGSSYFTYIYRSIDGGYTWDRGSMPGPYGQAEYRSMVIEDTCPSRLWAIDFYDHTVIRSIDGGTTWTQVATAGLPAFTDNTKIAVQHASCSGPATLYASVFSSDGLAGTAGYPGVYRSTDDGATWTIPSSPAGPSSGCLGQCGYDHELVVDPTNAAYVYMLGRDVWTSADGGATWVNRSGCFDDSNGYHVGATHTDQHGVAIRGSGASAVLYVVNDGGIWSYDLATNAFTNRNGNLAISELVALAVDPDTPGNAVSGLQDNGTITRNGSDLWVARLHGDGGACGWMQTVPGAANPFDGAFGTYINNTGYRSTDGGLTFGGWASNASFASEGSEFYGPWVGTFGNNRVWHGAQSLWYCDFHTPCSGSWNKFGTTNIAGLTSSAFVSKLAVNNPSSGLFGPFYAANAYPRAFLQSNDGLTWNDRTGTLPNRYISSVVFDPTLPNSVWVTLSGFGTGHVFHSADGGTTWVDKSGDLPNVPVNAILVDPQDRTNTWYVATDTGVYGTSNGASSVPNWSVVGENLPAVVASDLQLDSNRVLYVATSGRSVWTIQLPGCSFGGILSARNGSTSTCEIDLGWSAATADCGAVKYNVYRSTTLGDLGTRLASCVIGTNFVDQSAASGATYYYTVRSERADAGAGPCGGTEDGNTTQRTATAIGGTPGTAFSDSFETGTGLNGWGTVNFGGGTQDWRGIESCTNHTNAGSKDFRCGGTTCSGTYSVSKWAGAYPVSGTGIAIPAGTSTTRLGFWHKWDFEPSYDGAQLFVDAGKGYYAVPSSAFLLNGPNGTLLDRPSTCGSSRPGGGGWSVWTGTSTASWTNTIVDLDAVCNSIYGNTAGCAGKSVKIAFTENTDCVNTQTGWFLDDVQVTYTTPVCSPTAAPPEVSGGTTAQLKLARNGANLDFTWQDVGVNPEDYNLYAGTLGSWFSHSIFRCHLTPPAISCAAGQCSAPGLPLGSGSLYYLITATNAGGESNAGGAGWSGPNHTTPPVYTVPAACGIN